MFSVLQSVLLAHRMRWGFWAVIPLLQLASFTILQVATETTPDLLEAQSVTSAGGKELSVADLVKPLAVNSTTTCHDLVVWSRSFHE